MLRLFLFLLLLGSMARAQSTNNIGSGNALSLDGLDDKVDLGANFNNLSLPVTIMAWVRIGTSTVIQPIFSSSSHPTDWHGLWMHCSANRIQAGFADGSGGFAPPGRRVKRAFTNFSLANDWFHVAAVIVDANDVRLYVNGIEQVGSFTGGATTMVNNPSGNADIGYHKRAVHTYFNGDIDEVRIWDIGLTELQIRQQMCRQANPTMPGLKAAYDFNEGQTSSSLADATGTYNGTRSGGAQSVASGAAVGNSSGFFYNVSPGSGLVDSEAGIDSIRVLASGNVAGLQLYKVDSLPKFSNGASPATGVNHYYGVISAIPTENYQVQYFLNPNFYSPNTYDLASRNNNSLSTWGLNGNGLNPSLILTNQGPHQELLISEDTTAACTGPGQLPENYESCSDSIVVIVPNSLSNLNWNDGDSSRRKVFYRGQSNPTYFLNAVDNSSCSTRDTINLLFKTANYTPVDDLEICDSVTINLSPLIQAIQWDNGSTSRRRTFFNPGTYWYSAIDPISNCSFTDSLKVSRRASDSDIGSFAGARDPYCLGDTVRLTPPDGFSVRWPNGSDSTYLIWQDKVIRTQLFGNCFDTLIFIDRRFTDCGCVLKIPNAFTPNGDGLNDFIKPMGICEFKNYNWRIFNRWGELIFSTNDPEEYFDGRMNGLPIPEGGYVYKVFLQTPTVERSINGTFTLIR